MAITTRPERPPVTTKDLPAVITSSETARALIQPFLPEGVSLDRVAASVRIALAKDRASFRGDGPSPLERCSPMSVLMSVAKIAQWGLEVGETAHLVPFGAECTPIADYKGLAELVISSGVARHVEAHCVYENEPFRLSRGSSGTQIEHQPVADTKARGALLGAYAMFFLRAGIVMVEYMAASEIDTIRQTKSKQWKSGALPEWYARKTVVRRGVKLLPKNPRLLERLAALDTETIEVPAELAALGTPADVVDPETGEVLEPAPAPRGPKPLAQAEDGAYGLTPVAPDSVNDHAEADRGSRAEDFEAEFGGELALGAERAAPTRRNALREG